MALGWSLTQAWAFDGLDCMAVNVCCSARLQTEWTLGLGPRIPNVPPKEPPRESEKDQTSSQGGTGV